MTDFRIGIVPSSSALYVYSMRETIWFEPPYQRSGDVWPIEKRQLLMDSIINGYDLPKLYFHEFFPAREVDGRRYRYAIVDGKQRLQSIFEFVEGKFPLANNVEYLPDPSQKIAGLTYSELARCFPDIKTRFDGYVLPIIAVQTHDTELIEDMFSRLNEAVPLNAAEKRNAFGGPIPSLVRQIAQEPFFTRKLPFSNSRYRHFDLATKFMYFEHKNGISDTRKFYLDEFVKDPPDSATATALASSVLDNIRELQEVFIDEDPLLRSVGMVVLYYHVVRTTRHTDWKLSRALLDDFEVTRQQNRWTAEKDFGQASYEFLEFDRLAQSLNDGVALEYRLEVLARFVETYQAAQRKR